MKKGFWLSPAGAVLIGFIIILILALVGQLFSSLIHILAILVITTLLLLLSCLVVQLLDESSLNSIQKIFGQSEKSKDQ